MTSSNEGAMGKDDDKPESYPADYVDAIQRDADQRVIMAELRARAQAAGMIDTDALKLLDLSKATLAEDGSLLMPEGFFDQARRAKPYLFAQPAASGSTARVPHHAPPQPRLATEMSLEEWQAARAALLRRH